jgi:hypothetical protein
MMFGIQTTKIILNLEIPSNITPTSTDSSRKIMSSNEQKTSKSHNLNSTPMETSKEKASNSLTKQHI